MQIITRTEALSRLRSPENLINKISELGREISAPSVPDAADVETEVEEESPDQPSLSLSDFSEEERSFLRAAIPSGGGNSKPIVSADALLQSVLELVDENGNLPKKTVGQRGKAMPAILRELVGIEAHLTAPGAVAEEYGISSSQVSEYKRGHVGGKPSESLQASLEKELGKVRDLALRKLKRAIRFIDDSSLSTLDGLQLSSVARNMSAVVERTIPAHLKNQYGLKTADEQKAQFVVVVPQINQESKYRQLEVGSS